MDEHESLRKALYYTCHQMTTARKGPPITWQEALQAILPEKFPRIVTLGGSTRFRKDYQDETVRLTMAGNIVITVGAFGRTTGLDLADCAKQFLAELQLCSIDLCQTYHVINGVLLRCPDCGNFMREVNTMCECGVSVQHLVGTPYIGESTTREIAYATATGKLVTYMYPRVA
jgi:hypothetical protein